MNQSLSSRKPGAVSRSPFGGSVLSRPFFDEFFNQFLTEGNGPFAEAVNAAMDVAETDQTFEVTMDLPGVQADEVDIHIDNNTLTISGKRTSETEEKDEKKHYHRVERSSGSFSRSVVLPATASEEGTSAEFENGVLKITIPKSDQAKPRKIKIKK